MPENGLPYWRLCVLTESRWCHFDYTRNTMALQKRCCVQDPLQKPDLAISYSLTEAGVNIKMQVARVLYCLSRAMRLVFAADLERWD